MRKEPRGGKSEHQEAGLRSGHYIAPIQAAYPAALCANVNGIWDRDLLNVPPIACVKATKVTGYKI